MWSSLTRHPWRRHPLGRCDTSRRAGIPGRGDYTGGGSYTGGVSVEPVRYQGGGV